MICIRANKPGSVCATQANPFSGLARAAGRPRLSNALPGLSAYLECKMIARSEVDSRLHKLANHIECQLGEIIRELLIESRCEHAREIVYNGLSFIEGLRDASAGKEGDE